MKTQKGFFPFYETFMKYYNFDRLLRGPWSESKIANFDCCKAFQLGFNGLNCRLSIRAAVNQSGVQSIYIE